MKIANKNLNDQIEEWKKEHKKLFKIVIDNKDYIFRRIKRKEYSEIMSIVVAGEVEDRIYARQCAIAKATILNVDAEELEEDFEELAGLAVTISEEVLEKSGFVGQLIEL